MSFFDEDREEMKEDLQNDLCSHGVDMLAYLYGEMDQTGRDTFELHLAECGHCIDEFAALSQSRYPVFEWKQLEFDPLPTPRVVLPVEETVSASWFDKFRSAFAFRPALTFGSVSAFALLAALGTFILIGGPGEVREIAEAEPSITPTPADLPARVAAPTSSTPVERVKEKKAPLEVQPKVVNAAARDPKPAVRPARAKVAPSVRREQQVPSLSMADEDEDDSLRLADIFDEIDTSE